MSATPELGAAEPRRQWRNAPHVLCVRLDSMGDVLMTTPAMRALKQMPLRGALPRRLTLLTSKSGAQSSAHRAILLAPHGRRLRQVEPRARDDRDVDRNTTARGVLALARRGHVIGCRSSGHADDHRIRPRSPPHRGVPCVAARRPAVRRPGAAGSARRGAGGANHADRAARQRGSGEPPPGYLDELLVFPGAPGFPEQTPRPDQWAAFIGRAHACRFDLAIQMHGFGERSNTVVERLGAARCGASFPPARRLRTGGSCRGRNLALLRFLGARDGDTSVELPIIFTPMD